MAIRLGQAVVDKIRGEFPALSINQLAGKYGVSWLTVKNIVAPPNKPVVQAASHRRKKPAVDGETDVEAIVNETWAGLPLAQKLRLLLRR